jgi:hypothetical protein
MINGLVRAADRLKFDLSSIGLDQVQDLESENNGLMSAH